ncbi:MAG: zinc ribbon domain-containing protein [Ruminococcaceae bacterium]|nr:zinc ribbon domain-containing protein [Oscillospiraceae bacterium]
MTEKCCSECGAELKQDAKFCAKCGAPVQNVPEEEKIFCPECGVELEQNAEFCPECGTPLQSAPETNVCSECGAELKQNAEFCAECGAPVQNAFSGGETAVAVAAPVTATAYTAVPSIKRFPKRVLIIAAAAVAVIAVVLVIVLNIPKNVNEMNFNFDGFSGVYNGIARGGVPQGDGEWLYEAGSVRMSAEGEWKNGALREGTVKVIYNGTAIGKISYSGGKWDRDDYKAFCDAADAVNFANAFK